MARLSADLEASTSVNVRGGLHPTPRILAKEPPREERSGPWRKSQSPQVRSGTTSVMPLAKSTGGDGRYLLPASS